MNQFQSLPVSQTRHPRRNPHAIPTSPGLLFPWALSAALALGIVFSAQAQNRVTLAWDPSPVSSIAGYRLYQGGVSGTYTNVIAVGNVTTATVSNLVAGGSYYFAVTAYDTNKLESGFSTSISYTVPLPPPTIALISPVTGSSFTTGSTVALGAAVTANGHTVNQVVFYNGATKLGADTTSPFSFSWNNVSPGTYTLSASVVYDAGSTVSSAPATISVTGGTPALGTAFASDAGSISSPFVASGGLVYQAGDSGVADGGRAAYTFYLTHSGNYTISANVLAVNEGANSLFVNVDAEPTDPLMTWDIPVGPTLTNRTVSWRGKGTFDPATAQYSPKVFALSAGTHQLIVRGREAYTRFGAITLTELEPRLNIRPGSGGGGGISPADGSTVGSASPAMTLGASGQPGQSYDVYRSPDLKTWTLIGTLTIDATGAGSFTDSPATTQPSSFYRLQGR